MNSRAALVMVLALSAGFIRGSWAADKPGAPKPETVPPGWTPPEVRVPFGKAPALDGIVAQGEWDDALVLRRMNDPWPHDTMAQQTNVTYDAADLGCAVRMKHDGARLYVLCEIADDLLYNLDTEEWAPAPPEPKPGRKSEPPRGKPYWKSPEGQEDWGWWGDCFEIGICANTNGGFRSFPVTGPADTNRFAECWKVQGNISYGRIMAGSLLQEWVDNGAMKCAMKHEEKKGYVLEWAIAFDPCFATGDGRHYEPGKSPGMGLQLFLLDADTPESAAGSLNKLIHHQGVWPYCGTGPKKSRVNWARLCLDTPGAIPQSHPTVVAQNTQAAEPDKAQWEPRMILPDRSEGLAGLVGPFLWGRSADLGAEVRFCDQNGAPAAEGDYLWLYQFKRGGRTNPECIQLHERNNLTSIHPEIAYDFQPSRVFLNTALKSHVLKLMVGYVQRDFRFLHGDNTDLVHLVNTARVCAFVPIARTTETNLYSQANYAVDTSHDQPTVGVFELAAGETIASGPIYSKIAKKRILLDLRETLGRKTPNYPIAQKPIFRFTIEGQGKWTLRIEPDGRDGLEGGTDVNGWDMTFTESSPGARPYTVGLEPADSKWALSVFSPGGSETSSEILVGLTPFDRATGQPVAWPKRDQRIRTKPVAEIERALASGSALSDAFVGSKRR